MDHEGGDHYTADQGGAWLLAAGLGPWAYIVYRLYSGSVCDDSVPELEMIAILLDNTLYKFTLIITEKIRDFVVVTNYSQFLLPVLLFTSFVNFPSTFQ